MNDTEFTTIMCRVAASRGLIELADGRTGRLISWGASKFKVNISGKHVRLDLAEFKRVIPPTTQGESNASDQDQV